MRIIGLMSGTSHDAIDAALVEFAGPDGGLTLNARLLAHRSFPYAPALRARLAAALPPAAASFGEVCQLDTLIGQAFAAAASDVLQDFHAAAVCSHGQTVYHWVDGTRALGTLQIGQPAWIAEATGLPVVADVRARDLAAGGQGAPLASLIDALVLGRDRPGAALNLGGIANVTRTGPAGVAAFDTGPANALIDAAVVAYGLDPAGFDRDGRIAAAGTVDQGLLDDLMADPYYALTPPKTTGKEHFHWDYLKAHLGGLDHPVRPDDLVATVTELTVQTVAAAIRPSGAEYVLTSGGGARNRVIMAGLARALPDAEVATTAAAGLDPAAKEAILMALIGWCTLHGVPGTVLGGTGAVAPRILGSITPGAGPLELPPPAAAPLRLALEDAR